MNISVYFILSLALLLKGVVRQTVRFIFIGFEYFPTERKSRVPDRFSSEFSNISRPSLRSGRAEKLTVR